LECFLGLYLGSLQDGQSQFSIPQYIAQTGHGDLDTSPSLVLGTSIPICSLDILSSLVGSPSCSLDILLSLATNTIIPSCSFDVSSAPSDNSYCLPEDSLIPPEKPCPDIGKGFNALFKEVTLFFQSFLVEEPVSEVYNDSGLNASEEEIVFYKEHVEPPPSLV